jgi:hypothetical protein
VRKLSLLERVQNAERFCCLILRVCTNNILTHHSIQNFKLMDLGSIVLY